MTLRPGSLTFLIVAIAAFGTPGFSYAQTAPRQVTVYVDTVLAADTHEGVDKRLIPMLPKLHGLFSFTTYSLVNHQEGPTECGKMIAFQIPGGKILHVQPRAVDGDMIAMEIVLFDGTRPMMTTDLKLKNGGTLIVGGPRYEQGMMFMSIGASSGASVGAPAEAGAGSPPRQVAPAEATTQ
jgi:hypothetical protein